MNAYAHDYPNEPGHRGVDTSVEGADKIAPHTLAIAAMVLQAVVNAGPNGLTVVEGCARYGWDRHGAQPRFTELKLAGKIADSGLRRRNPSGVRAIAWVAVENGEASNV